MKKSILLVYILLLIILESCNRRDKVLVIVRGDSFANGIGSSGTSSSASFYRGQQVQGDSTWGKQLHRILNKRDDYSYDVDMVGFPGQTAGWFIKSGELSKTKKVIADTLKEYKYVVYCSEFGTNEATIAGVNTSTSVDSLVNDLRFITKEIKSLPYTASKLYVIAYPLTRRVDKFAQSESNNFRNKFNEIILQHPHLVGADLTMRFGACPSLYSDNAPYGERFNHKDVDRLDGVHLNDAGYYQLAQLTADAVVNAIPPISK